MPFSKPQEQPEIDRFRNVVREQLDKEAFQSAWVKGQTMSLEQVIAFTLEEKPDNG